MKLIVMLMSQGNNETAWARLASKDGRCFLDDMSHREEWQQGQLVYRGPSRTQQRRLARAAFVLFDDFIAVIRQFSFAASAWRRHGTIDVIVGASIYGGLAALLARKLGLARKTVLVTQDFFPICGSLPARLWRRWHSWRSCFIARRSDEVWQVSSRTPTGLVNPHNYVIPIYIENRGTAAAGRTDIAYVGNPIPDHRIDVLFDICRKHRLKLHFFGDSAYLRSIRKNAPDDAVFYGFVELPERLSAIFGHCFCGYAIYEDTSPANYAWYGVPSKIYVYLANNVPVVTTDITDFSHNVQGHTLGHLITPTPDAIEAAVLDLRDHFPDYYAAISRFREDWNRKVEDFLADRLAAL